LPTIFTTITTASVSVRNSTKLWVPRNE
jgi:hypothetical protein